MIRTIKKLKRPTTYLVGRFSCAANMLQEGNFIFKTLRLEIRGKPLPNYVVSMNSTLIVAARIDFGEGDSI